MKPVRRISADAVVVGTGPGGATVAAKLAAAGRNVVVLEKGRDHKWLGNHLAALAFTDRGGMLFTEEGLNVVRAVTTGGCTLIYCGSATEPPSWLRDRHGVDLGSHVAQTIAELRLEPLPDEMCGTAAMRLLEAAQSLGYKWHKLRKFIDPARCRMVCGGTCMLGCPYGAKWTAREYLDDAVRSGAKLVTRADVLSVTHEDGVATGVVAVTPRGLLEVAAPTVVLAAGGLGTPIVLQRSGIHEAGVGIFVDPLVMVSAVSRERGTSSEPPMTVGTYEMIDEGILLSNLIDPWALSVLMTAAVQPSKVHQVLAFPRKMGIMVKVGDECQGMITVDGRISKPLTARDRGRLNKGACIARDILIRAGCDPRSVVVGPVRGAHPGATARIGTVVDANLQTRIRNLYVSDASVIPEALDRPVVLTVIALAKRLSDHLLARDGIAATRERPAAAVPREALS
jgi:choline dehydrogenase-like flavoprotein